MGIYFDNDFSGIRVSKVNDDNWLIIFESTSKNWKQEFIEFKNNFIKEENYKYYVSLQTNVSTTYDYDTESYKSWELNDGKLINEPEYFIVPFYNQ
jgi:hypothetical protein